MAESLVMSLLQYFKKASTAKDSNTNNDHETDGQMQNIDVENCNDNVKQQKIQAFVSKIGEKRKHQSLPSPTQKRRKWKDDYVKYGFFFQKVSRAIFILQLNAYFALWNMPTRTLCLRNSFPT